MESIFTDHFSPSSTIHFSPSPKPLLHEEYRPLKRVRANFNNPPEGSVNDAQFNSNVVSTSKVERKPSLLLRPKIRKSTTIDIQKSTSTHSLNKLKHQAKNDFYKEDLKKNKNSSRCPPVSNVSTCARPEQHEPSSLLQLSKDELKPPIRLTRRGYDVKLVREYMKRKRKENKLTDHNELLKGIFKPLHHVASPPRPAAKPKEMRQKVLRYMVQRKEKEKKMTLEHLRRLENEKKKKEEVLAELERERRLKLEENLKHRQETQGKKKQLFHTSIMNFDVSHCDENISSVNSQKRKSTMHNILKEPFIHNRPPNIQVYETCSSTMQYIEPYTSERHFVPCQYRSNSQNHFSSIDVFQEGSESEEKGYEEDKIENFSSSLMHSSNTLSLNKKSRHYHNPLSPKNVCNSQTAPLSSFIHNHSPIAACTSYDEQASVQANADLTDDRLENYDVSDTSLKNSPPPKFALTRIDTPSQNRRCDSPDNINYYRPLNIYSRHAISSSSVNDTRSTFASVKNNLHSPPPSLSKFNETGRSDIQNNKASPELNTQSLLDSSSVQKPKPKIEPVEFYSSINDCQPACKSSLPSAPSDGRLKACLTPEPLLPPCEVSSLHHPPLESNGSTLESESKINQTLTISSEIIESVKQFQKIIKKDILNIDSIKKNYPKMSNSSGATLKDAQQRVSTIEKSECLLTDKKVEKYLCLPLESNGLSSVTCSTSEFVISEANIQKLVNTHLSPLIEEIENKLQRLHLLLSSENLTLNLTPNNSLSSSKQVQVHQQTRKISQPLLPLPLFDEKTEQTHSSSCLLNKSDIFESELSFICHSANFSMRSAELFPEIQDNVMLDQSESMICPIGLDSKHDNSFLESVFLDVPQLSISSNLNHVEKFESNTLENEIPPRCTEKNIEWLTVKNKNESNTENLLPGSIPESVSEAQFQDNSSSGSPLSSISSLVENMQDKPSNEREHLVSHFNNLLKLNLTASGTTQKGDLSAPIDSDIQEESLIAPSPNISKLFEYAEAAHLDTFISCSNFLNFHETQLNIEHSSLIDLSNPLIHISPAQDKDNDAEPYVLPIESLLSPSSRNSSTINTEIILNTSCGSSLISIQGDATNLLSAIKQHDSHVLKEESNTRDNYENNIPTFLEEICEEKCDDIDKPQVERENGCFSTETRYAPAEVEVQKSLDGLNDTKSSRSSDELENVAANDSKNLSNVSLKAKSPKHAFQTDNHTKSLLFESEKDQVSEIQIETSFSKPSSFEQEANKNCTLSSCSDIEECLSTHSVESSQSIEFACEKNTLHPIPERAKELDNLIFAEDNFDSSDFKEFENNSSLNSISDGSPPFVPPEQLENEFLISLLHENSSFSHDPTQSQHNKASVFEEKKVKNSNPILTSHESMNLSPSKSQEVENKINTTIQQFIKSLCEETSRSVLSYEAAFPKSLLEFRDMGYAEQYIKFLLLHHHSSISEDTKFNSLTHPLFKDAEYNQLLTDVLKEFQTNWFRRSRLSPWPSTIVPACTFYRAIITMLRKNSISTISDQLVHEVQQEQDSVFLIDFALFLEDKVDVAVSGLIHQLVDETLI